MKRLELGLRHFQSSVFQRTLEIALSTIDEAFRMTRSPKPYIAFSGGKDSTVVAALVHHARPSVPLVWNDAELEFPETVELMSFLQSYDQHILVPCKSTSTHGGWFSSWSSTPYFRDPLPNTVSAETGAVLRQWLADEKGYNLTFLGTTAHENRRRRDWFLRVGLNYYWQARCVRSCPIGGWTADDVWALIAGWKLGFNRAYMMFDALKLDDALWRVGPLPLVPKDTLMRGWPDLLTRLQTRYGHDRWTK